MFHIDKIKPNIYYKTNKLLIFSQEFFDWRFTVMIKVVSKSFYTEKIRQYLTKLIALLSIEIHEIFSFIC